MSVNYRELMKDYMWLVCELEGTDHFNQMGSHNFGTEEWEAVCELHKEMLDESLPLDE